MAEDQPVILRVGFPGPLPTLFDYLGPTGGDQVSPQPGMRVLAPFRSTKRVGLIVQVTSESACPDARLKAVESVLDPAPLLAPDDLALILWAAEYYKHPPGDALFSALPARMRAVGAPAGTDATGWRISAAARARALDELARAPKQAGLVACLMEYPEGLATSALIERCGDCAATARALAKKGWIEPCRVREADPPERRLDAGPRLDDHQLAAVDAIHRGLGRFAPFLLEGVTGSGKTEVYIRALHSVLDAGRQALVLVPEIGLTPQFKDRLARRLPGRLVTLHSSLSALERERGWRRAATGEAAVVLGTRSAVFVPLPRLGLIVVDEEHDLSFKQQDGFRYYARDLAVRRAQQSACPIILGTATPSLETVHNARQGRYERLSLPERAGGARPPVVEVLDIRSQPLRAGVSTVLLRLMREQFDAGNQVLVFLNRRGFAPLLTCHDCGWVADCPHCDARMTLHLNIERLWCHHCGAIQSLHPACPSCGSLDLTAIGQGTERLEQVLAECFPDVPMARLDRDSTRRKGALDRLLEQARAGEYRLLLGTQMLAKGHHFPDVTLVGILDVDQGLYGADFRAPERMAQLVVQVAGRAGRAEKPGRVVLQTRHPTHPLLQLLIARGYPAFAAAALRERQAAGLPPYAYQTLVRAESVDSGAALEFLRRAAAALRPPTNASVAIWGPIPAPMERRAGRYRAQLLIHAERRWALQDFLARWVEAVRGIERSRRVRWSVDVDPQEML